MGIIKLNSKNIFLFDAVGAAISLLSTVAILPIFSEALGLPKNLIYSLALFPLIYAVYSSICYKLPFRKPWMLMFIMLANGFYVFVSASLILAYDGITVWGQLVLFAEILVLLGVIVVESSVYRKHFLK